MIWLAEQPASASRRHAALRSPWVWRRLPAWEANYPGDHSGEIPLSDRLVASIGDAYGVECGVIAANRIKKESEMAATVILTLSNEVRLKLSKLVALLGSSIEGEKLSAVSAIERTLVAEGLDFNAFAEFIAFGQQLESSDLTKIVRTELRGMVREAKAGAWALSESERTFIRE